MLRGQFLGYVIVRLPYEAGVEKEAEYFRDLVVSSQAAAQRYSLLRELFRGYVIIRLPYEAGVEKEAEYFRDLVVSSQAAAQRYSFFAERAISRVCYN